MCYQHPTWRNVFVKRKIVAFQYGAIGPEATSPEDIAFRQALHERYLEPYMTTQGQYKAHLESLSHGISVRPIKAVPILLFAGELPEEEDNQYISWVYRKRQQATPQHHDSS